MLNFYSQELVTKFQLIYVCLIEIKKTVPFAQLIKDC